MKIGSALACTLALLLGGVGFPWAVADTRYELRVDGMACPYCAYGIEKKLKAVRGVIDESVEFRLNEGVVRFRWSEEAMLPKERLEKLISDAGYTLRSVTTESIPSGEADAGR